MKIERIVLALGAAALLGGCNATLPTLNSGAPAASTAGAAPASGSAPAGGSASSGLGALSSALQSTGVVRSNSAAADILEGASATLRDYTAEEQRELGRGFSSVLLGARPLLRNEAVQRYVNQVGLWVAMQADRPRDGQGREIQFAWRFGVIDSERINAYATPGGFVFVTSALLKRMGSEAELAGVLGHEIAHVVRGHYISAIKKGGFTQIAGGVVRARVGDTALTNAMVNAAKNIYTKGLDQADEYDADVQGLLYAVRAGYAPVGLPNVLRMYAAAGSARDINYQLLFSTHPNPNDRVARLDPLVATKYARAPRVTNDARYAAIKRLIP